MSDRKTICDHLNEDFERRLGHWNIQQQSGKIYFEQGGPERYFDVVMDAYLPVYALVHHRSNDSGYMVVERHEMPAFWAHIEQKNAEAVEKLFKKVWS